MVFLFKIIFGIYLVISISVLGVDYVLNFCSQMKRFHIGRWTDEQVWRNAIRRRAYKWLIKTPTVRKTDNYRYILLDILKGDYRNATIQSWQTAGLILGINEINDAESKKVIQEWKSRNLTVDGDWVKLGQKVDFALLAYAVLKTTDDVDSVKPAMDSIIKLVERNKCADGLISYSQGCDTNIRFVDTLGMVCPFLAAYGVAYRKPAYVSLAVTQIEKFREFGLLQNTSLPCHAYNVQNNTPLGIYGWGRGTAWYFLALVNTWKEINESPEKEKLEAWMKEAAENYLQYQSVDGGYNTILQGGGQYDSSVTAAMAYFYQNCGCVFQNETYFKVAQNCLRRLRQFTMKNGAIDVCQGDTHGIGTFSQVFDIMPFVQGLVLQTLSMKEEDVDGTTF